MFWKRRRYIVVFMAFLGFFNVYSLRVNLSVAIVAMTENRTVHYENGTVGYVSIIPNETKLEEKLFFIVLCRNDCAHGLVSSSYGVHEAKDKRRACLSLLSNLLSPFCNCRSNTLIGAPACKVTC